MTAAITTFIFTPKAPSSLIDSHFPHLLYIRSDSVQALDKNTNVKSKAFFFDFVFEFVVFFPF